MNSSKIRDPRMWTRWSSKGSVESYRGAFNRELVAAVAAYYPTEAKALKGVGDSILYFVGVHRYHYQAGIPAQILWVGTVTPEGLPPRPCFRVLFPNRAEDYALIVDEDLVGKAGLGVLYFIITEEQVRRGEIPALSA